MKEKIKCPECYEEFRWDEEVIIVGGKHYHKECLNLYANGYIAFSKYGDCLGETENHDGETAFMILDTDDDEEVEE